MERLRERTDTSQQILDIAQRLVQTRGYNAFSYADIAQALKITKASLHYHFPSKAELGHSLIQRYESRFRKRLDEIDANSGAPAEKLRSYVQIYARVLADNRMCLCGMLAAEFQTLPRLMQSALDHFFEVNERWLETVLDEGRHQGELHFQDSAGELAQFLVASLEGAMMLARSHGSEQRFHSAAKRLLAEIGIS